MFIPLHVKSDNSLGFGTASIEELVQQAVQLGYPAIALTDRENLYGQVSFHHHCRQHGIKPITGLELVDPAPHEMPHRIVLLAQNSIGYRSLCRVVTRRRGSTPTEDILGFVAEENAGLFVLSDQPAVIERMAGNVAMEQLGLLLVRPNPAIAEKAVLAAAARLGVRLVADLDAVFPQVADRSLHLLQLAIASHRKIAEISQAADPQRWLRSPEEAARLFNDQPETLKGAAEIAEACCFDLLAQTSSDKDDTSAGIVLRQHCRQILDNGRRRWTEVHDRRLEQELALFEQLGFSRLMLVIAEILEHCRQEDIPVVARGSAVSSLVLYLLGGSLVDPISHRLLLERFLHPGKTAWPDIDLDLPWHRRNEVIDWVYQHFGRGNVAMVATLHTFRHRSALREGMKAFAVQPNIIDQLCRLLPPEDLPAEVDFLGLAQNLEEDPLEEPLRRYGGKPGLAEILSQIRRLVGRPRHLAAHPGGIVIGRQPLGDLLPLELAPKGVVVTQYDIVSVSRLGLVKIDLLGNRCLSELEETFRLAGRARILLETVPTDDQPTLALIDKASTIGCFQLESPAMRNLLARLPIRSLNDVIAALALIRPGAAAGEVKNSFVSAARGERPVRSDFPELADRLDQTYGMFLYEEDIMLLLSRYAGLTLPEADELRRAIIKSGGEPAVLAELETRFVTGARSHGVPENRVATAWQTAVRLAAYSFNKAHAASYAMLAYLSAYTKVHYPLDFATSLLNHHQGLYPLRVLGGEFRRMGMQLLAPHVNHSGYSSSCHPPDQLRMGLDKVKGLSRAAAERILREREAGTFRDLADLLARVRLGKRELAALVLAGACDGLTPLAAADYPFAHETVIEQLQHGCLPESLENLPIPRPAVRDANVVLYQALVRARNELRLLEMHVSDHPMALLRHEASRYGCQTIAAVPGKEENVRLAVLLAAMRRVMTGQGAMQFLTLEDETGLLEAVLLPAGYRRIGEQVTSPGPYLVGGRMKQIQGAVHLEVAELAPFHRRRMPFG